MILPAITGPEEGPDDDAELRLRLRRSISAPIFDTPGDFGLDRLMAELDAARAMAANRRRHRRWLRLVARARRWGLRMLVPRAGHPR